MKFQIFLFSVLVIFSSCSKELEPEPCSVSSFVGNWRVKIDQYSTNCAPNSTIKFTIEKGDLPNQIKMKFDGKNDLIFDVSECSAFTAHSSFGAASSVKMKYENHQISLTKLDVVLLIPLYCNMTLVKD